MDTFEKISFAVIAVCFLVNGGALGYLVALRYGLV
jgi:hypothetical protein